MDEGFGGIGKKSGGRVYHLRGRRLHTGDIIDAAVRTAPVSIDRRRPDVW